MNKKQVVLIGYSGHAHVVQDILQLNGRTVVGYCELEEKKDKPSNLMYLGQETDTMVLAKLKEYDCFVAIGENTVREKTSRYLLDNGICLINAIHPSASVSASAILGTGVMIGPNSVINANASIQDGVVCNSGSVVEHDCQVGAFSHICPGAVLGGNVNIGELTLIGTGAVILLNLCIGNCVTVGAGTVVIKSIKDNMKVVGNPHQPI